MTGKNSQNKKSEKECDEGMKKPVATPTGSKRPRKMEDNGSEEKDVKFFKPIVPPRKAIREKLLNLVGELSSTMCKLQAETNGPTTKRSIKDLVSTLSSIVSQIDTDGMKEVIRNNEVLLKTCEVGTQTEKPGWKKFKTVQSEELDKIENMSDFLNIEKEIWTEELFKNTKIVVGNPILTPGDALVWQTEDDKEMNKTLSKMFKERYPELTELEGDLDYIINQTKIGKSKEETSVKEKFILKAKIGQEDTLFRVTTEIKQLLEKENRKEIAVPKPDGWDAVKFKKMVQTIFNDTDINVSVHIPQANRGNIVEGKRRSYAESALIIKASGSAYADKLKEIKEKAADMNLADKIKEVRKTKTGDVLLKLKTREEVAVLKSTLNKGGLQCKETGEKKTTVFISGIDPTVNEDEVLSKINDITQNKTSLEVLYKKENGRTGNYLLAINMNTDTASKVLETGRIKFGFCECKVKEKTNLQRCFKCWDFGHTAIQCKGEDRAGSCFKCGRKGHKAKDCTEEHECVICRVKGHQTGSFNCPAFKQALKKQNRSSRQTTSVEKIAGAAESQEEEEEAFITRL